MKESFSTNFFWLSWCYGIFLLQNSENSKFCLCNHLSLSDFPSHSITETEPLSEAVFQLKAGTNKLLNLQNPWHVWGLLAAQTLMGGKRKTSEILAVHWGRVWGQILLPLTLFSFCWRIWWWNLATCSQFHTWAAGYLSLNSELGVHGTVTAQLCNPCGFLLFLRKESDLSCW